MNEIHLAHVQELMHEEHLTCMREHRMQVACPVMNYRAYIK